MLDGKEVDCVGLREIGSGDVKAVVDLGGQGVQVVLGVEIEVDAVVTEGFHVCLAAGGDIAL